MLQKKRINDMRNCYSICFCLVFICLITSCERKVSETITFYSPDTELKLVVSGERYSDLDPWMMTIEQVLSDSVINSAQVEAQLDLPTKENVLVRWESSTSAVITFIERNGEKNMIPVRLIY